jgi:uncharacterized repeat protein (TIGR03803 family)
MRRGKRQMALLALCAAATMAMEGQTFTRLYNFCDLSGCADGTEPLSALVQGVDGNLYGTTLHGGKADLGTVFKITRSGTLTTVHKFQGADGQYPYAALVVANNGSFFGTTWEGGSHANGTVFQMTPSGKLSTLYSFCSQSACTDGSSPIPGLVLGRFGTL